MGKRILVAAGAVLFVYLMGAFIAADFNIATWDVLGRYMVGTIGTVLGLLIVASYTATKEN